MNIAKACIKHKVATLLAVIMVVIFGVLFGTRLQMALMPNMEMPMAVVMTTYVGANPSDIEELVTSPLESAIMSVSGVDEITSTSAENVSTIQITYLEGTDLDIAATKLREQFDRVSLPDDASDPIIVNINISELMPTAMIALVGDDLYGTPRPCGLMLHAHSVSFTHPVTGEHIHIEAPCPWEP